MTHTQEQPIQITVSPFRVIRVRYHGPTNTQGERLIADAGDSASRVVLGFDYGQSRDERWATAARAVVEKMGWTGEYYTPLVGGDYNGDYYFVFLPKA